MRQQQFEAYHNARWVELRGLLDELGRSGLIGNLRSKPDPLSHGRLPQLYREVCNHLALARSRRYSPALVAELHDLVLRGHRELYRGRSALRWRLLGFVTTDFPRALRRHIAYFWMALALFALPALVSGVYSYNEPGLIFSIMDPTEVADLEEMYDPANRTPGRSKERKSENAFVMFGYYINHNISIGFRTFAGGLLLGVGALFLILFNGVVLGGVAGHLTQVGYSATFWPFVCGHGAFELTAIVICGAAGLMLAQPLFAPGQLSRMQALKRQARASLDLVMGAALMLVAAAFIEAFWSSLSLAPEIKYAAAFVLWAGVGLYLGMAGRGADEPR